MPDGDSSNTGINLFSLHNPKTAISYYPCLIHEETSIAMLPENCVKFIVLKK